MNELFSNWAEQRAYNSKANVEDRLYTKTQMKKLFYLVPKEDATPTQVKIVAKVFRDGKEVNIDKFFSFYKFNQCEEPKRKERNAKECRSFEHRDDRFNDFDFDEVMIDTLEGAKVCVTGTLSIYTRKEIIDKLKSLGATVTSSVSKKTDYLLAGVNAGSKLIKAKELHTPIVSEEDMCEYFKEVSGCLFAH